MKQCVRTFDKVEDIATKAEMESVVSRALEEIRIPEELRQGCANSALEQAGLKGGVYFIVPTLFHLVASLQREGREFAILFRSFGKDHEKVKNEWNAFCELRHPLFSRLIADIGPLDGSVPHLPDRRVHTLHTLYRDEQGPLLILDTFTNGPEDCTWDAWAKSKPRPASDTRSGRAFVKALSASTVEGLFNLQDWMWSHVRQQATSAIKDDWAWWQWHGEKACAGKLMPLIAGENAPRQVFFDDNIEVDDPRIVDCRTPDGDAMPALHCLGAGLCVKVNPVEALLSQAYFQSKLRIDSIG